MGAATIVFMMFMMHISFEANLNSPPDLGVEMWIGLFGYLFAMAYLVFRLYRDLRITH